jgi:hypothetical protein
MVNVKKWSYGNYASGNYGAHCIAIQIGNVELYFSYDTVVAFCGDGEMVISQNVWGPTTGKHLNAIDTDKSRRVSREVFEEKLQKLLANHQLEIANPNY